MSAHRTFSGLYCLMILSVYISVTVNKLTHTNLHHLPETEIDILLCFLYSVSCLFLLYILLYLARLPTSYDNIKSHGSGFLRQGAVVFGVGSFIYHLLEFIEYFIIDLHPHCYDIASTAISCLSLVFVALQTVVVVLYPRLNINLASGIPHLGLIHLVTTNIVIWLRTVIKETLHEMESQQFRKSLTNHTNMELTMEHNDMEHNTTEKQSITLAECREKYHDDDFVADVLKASSPFLYAFIVEFSLVGGTFFYNTWTNIHSLSREEVRQVTSTTTPRSPGLARPNLCATLAKTDWSQSTAGTVAGCLVLLLTLMDLVMFLSNNASEQDTTFEYLGKILNTSINFLGFLAAVVAFFRIQKLTERKTTPENTVDLFLLDFGVFFVFIYSCLTITVGIFSANHSIPGSVHVINGVVEIIAVTFQTILIHQLLLKTIESEEAYLHGRNLVVFLSFVNFAIWLFDTFELQKSKASLIEAGYYGETSWVWLQRITLPVCVFFRSILHIKHK